MFKNLIKKFTPNFLLSWYHAILAIAANFFYGLPSRKIIVIGVTGTSGKSTVVELATKVLEEAGFKVGVASTIKFQIGKVKKLNDKKMTMLGRFQLQKLLAQMVKAGCDYAIVETTSEGIKQYRHLGINYDVLVFTNLYPEHIEAHGSFAKYKKAKGKLFKKLKRERIKKIEGKKIKKAIIVNIDDQHASYFLNFWAQEKYGFALKQNEHPQVDLVIKADQVRSSKQGTNFLVGQTKINLKILGQHNVYNALAAIVIGLSQGIKVEESKIALEKVEVIPGRIEFIDISSSFIKGQQPFKVIVDYAFEPGALKKLYQTIKDYKLCTGKCKIIHVIGSAGGGRDVSRRSILGELAGRNADFVIVTNEDPYDDDPKVIIKQVAQGAKKAGKKLGQNLFKITDRRKAIRKALTIAAKGDLVLITGKGCEQAIAGAQGKLIPWDDRKVVREEFNKLLTNQ